MTRHTQARRAGLAAALAAGLAATPALAAEAEAKARFDALLAQAWELEKQENPLRATAAGDHRYGDRLPSMTLRDLERRAEAARSQLEALHAIDRAALGPEDRVSYAMFERDLGQDLARHRFRAWRIPITSDSGFHTGISRLAQDVPLRTVKDYEDYLSRLRAIPVYFEQQVALMREGLRTGFTSPRVALEGYDATMRPHVVSEAEQSVFWKPFTSFPPGVPAGETERLRAAGRDAISKSVVPALQEPAQVRRRGVRAQGAREHRAVVGCPTARPTTRGSGPLHDPRPDPRESPRIGLAEVERIRGEMDAVMKKTGFQGCFAEFFAFLRTDPRFFATTPEELVTGLPRHREADRSRAAVASSAGCRAHPTASSRVPDDIAPKYAGGRYDRRRSPHGRPGYVLRQHLQPRGRVPSGRWRR